MLGMWPGSYSACLLLSLVCALTTEPSGSREVVTLDSEQALIDVSCRRSERHGEGFRRCGRGQSAPIPHQVSRWNIHLPNALACDPVLRNSICGVRVLRFENGGRDVWGGRVVLVFVGDLRSKVSIRPHSRAEFFYLYDPAILPSPSLDPPFHPRSPECDTSCRDLGADPGRCGHV